MLSLKKQELGETTVVHCSGQLVFPDADGLRVTVMQLPRPRKLMLDLADVIRVDAAGLGTFVSLYHWAEKTGTELKLMNLSSSLKYLLEITGLDAVLEICSVAEMLRLLHCSDPDLELADMELTLEAPPENAAWFGQDSTIGA